jgi:prepilin-type N-terminal cleavage/methylation domain-containing protein
MRRRRQRGETLVELLIAISIAGLVLAALAGLLYTVSDRFAGWGSRLDAATDGLGVTEALQADMHRYVTCVKPPQHTQTLDLCSPMGSCPLQPPVITYLSQGGLVTRTQGGNTVLVGRTHGNPVFDTATGAVQITVTQSETRFVYYHGPVFPC